MLMLDGSDGDIGVSRGSDGYADGADMVRPCHSSYSSSGDERSMSFCGDPAAKPSVVSFPCSMLMTEGFPPRKLPSTWAREWIRSLGPTSKRDSWFREGMIIITSASELATSKILDSYITLVESGKKSVIKIVSYHSGPMCLDALSRQTAQIRENILGYLGWESKRKLLVLAGAATQIRHVEGMLP